MIKKILLILFLVLIISLIEYNMFLKLKDNSFLNNSKQITKDLVKIQNLIKINGSKPIDINTLKSMSSNIKKIKIESTLIKIDTKSLQIMNPLYFISLVDDSIGKINVLNSKIYVNLNIPKEKIDIYINELDKNKKLIKYQKTITIKPIKRMVYFIEPSKWDLLLKEQNVVKTFNIKQNNKVIESITIEMSQYKLDALSVERILNIFFIINIIITLLLLLLTYFIFNKSILFNNSNLNRVSELKEKFISFEKSKNQELNSDIFNNNFQIYSENIFLKDRNNGKVFKQILVGAQFLSNNSKLSEIDTSTIRDTELNIINKHIIDFTLKNYNNLEEVIFPIFVKNLENNEFINWFEYTLLNNNLENEKVFINFLNKNTLKSFNKLTLRAKNQKIQFIITEKDSLMLNDSDLIDIKYLKVDKC